MQKRCYAQGYAHLARHVKQGSKSSKRLRTLAGRQVRDISRKPEQVVELETYEKQLLLMRRIVKQERKSKEKVYSLSSPAVSCIVNGKVDKQYEFCSKVSVATLPNSHVVVSVEGFSGNPYDSKTLSVALASIGRQFGKKFRRVLVDRGYRGHERVGGSGVNLPSKCTVKRGYAGRQDNLGRMGRSGIEAVQQHPLRII